MLLIACLLVIGCSESGAGTVPPPYTGDTGDTGDDTGTNPPPGGCPLPNRTACDGQFLDYCEGDEVLRIDCDEIFPGSMCVRAGINSSCSVPIGEECVVEHEGQTRYGSCRHSGVANDTASGCVQEAHDGEYFCVPDIGSCGSGGVRSCLPGPEANRYFVRGCLNAQSRVLDCHALGGSCTGNACRHLPEGSVCETDLLQSNKFLVCGTGLRCHNDDPLANMGVCAPI